MLRIFRSIGSIGLAIISLTILVTLVNNSSATGETFATGVMSLKIDNESYVTDNSGRLVYSTSTSWKPSSLAGKLFFDFEDLKPGDVGEDTISLHTNKQTAWTCMKVDITATPENGQNEPESKVDPTPEQNAGELQEGLYFAFWADDGDNVFEDDEKIFKEGNAEEIFDGSWWPLADSEQNIWQKEGWGYSYKKEKKWDSRYSCKPIEENAVRYVGKIWCFGDLKEDPLPQDGKSKTKTNGPLVRGTGWVCDGNAAENRYQTDGLKLDVSFLAMASKNNKNYTCGVSGMPSDDKDKDNKNKKKRDNKKDDKRDNQNEVVIIKIETFESIKSLINRFPQSDVFKRFGFGK